MDKLKYIVAMNVSKICCQVIFSMAALFVVSACSKDSGEEDYGYVYFDNNSTEVVSDEGATISRSIISNVSWRITPSADYSWIKVYPTSGNGNGSIQVTVSPNTSASNRNAYFELSSPYSDEEHATWCIIQQGVTNTGGSGSGGGASAQKPATPTGLRAVKSGNGINVSWNSVYNVQKYRLYYQRPYPYSATQYEDMYITTRTFEWDNMVSGTYTFWIVSISYENIESEASGKVTCEFSSTGGSSTQKPSTPTGLRAVQSGDGISVSWNSVSGAKYYQLHYSRPYPYDMETFENVYSTSATMKWNSMVSGTYTFWVVAVGDNYELSNASSKVTCNFSPNGSGSGGSGGGSSQSKLDTPKNLEAYSGGSYVQISFDEVSLAYQYELYRSTSPTYGYTKISASGGNSGKRYILTDNNPKTGTTYYKVKAVALSSLGISDSDLSNYVKVSR